MQNRDSRSSCCVSVVHSFLLLEVPRLRGDGAVCLTTSWRTPGSFPGRGWDSSCQRAGGPVPAQRRAALPGWAPERGLAGCADGTGPAPPPVRSAPHWPVKSPTAVTGSPLSALRACRVWVSLIMT